MKQYVTIRAVVESEHDRGTISGEIRRTLEETAEYGGATIEELYIEVGDVAPIEGQKGEEPLDENGMLPVAEPEHQRPPTFGERVSGILGFGSAK